MAKASGLWALTAVVGFGLAAAARFASRETATETAPPDGSKRPVLVLDPAHPCGPVALAAAAAWLNRPMSLEEANRRVAVDAAGRSSVADLVAGAQASGLAACGVRLDPASIRKAAGPVILHVFGSHFVMTVASGRRFVIVSPPDATKSVAESELSQMFEGVAVLVAVDRRSLEEELRRVGVAGGSGG